MSLRGSVSYIHLPPLYFVYLFTFIFIVIIIIIIFILFRRSTKCKYKTSEWLQRICARRLVGCSCAADKHIYALSLSLSLSIYLYLSLSLSTFAFLLLKWKPKILSNLIHFIQWTSRIFLNALVCIFIFLNF